MKRILIGHRGTGKSSFLLRHRELFPEVLHWDLDAVIESEIKLSVSDIFSEQGEESFRQIELQLFRQLVSENNSYVIAVGGGFPASQLEVLAPEATVIYLSRDTDADGRIFLNRPRLNEELSPLEESQQRYVAREKIFRTIAHRIYHLPEGFDEKCPSVAARKIEQKILTQNFSVTDAYYTLSKTEFSKMKNSSGQPTLFAEFKKLELRTDLLTEDEILKALELRPESLFSVRTVNNFSIPPNVIVDEDVDFYTGRSQIVSSHVADVREGISLLSSDLFKNKKLKLCPLVKSFEELLIGHQWQSVDTEQRSFLPRSSDGRWLWYRMLAKYRQPINFIRGLEFTLDQPSLFQWMALPEKRPSRWGAVLGEPVHFSRSPLTHMDYFSQRQTYFTRIVLGSDEFRSHFKFLIDCGLGYAAVTAPLKESAFDFAPDMQNHLKAINTLYIKDKSTRSENTDVLGFKSLVSAIGLDSSIAVWGGGGTLGMMQSVLPEAHYFSARTGELRNPRQTALPIYDYLIWAAPRKKSMSWPDADRFKFKCLIDLNYANTSAGLEFAAANKIRYISGLEMFQTQALAQQNFWSLCERQ